MHSIKSRLFFLFQSETSTREVDGAGGRGLLQNPSRVRANAVAAVKSDANSSNVLGLPGPPPPLQVGGASRPVGPTHSQTILMKQLQNRLTVKRSELPRSSEHLSISSEKISPSNSQIADLSKKDVTNQKPRPSRNDKKALLDVHPSSSLLASSKGSSLTSSWESFTRPVKLTERQQREEEEEEGEEEWVEPRREEGHLLTVPVRSSLSHSDVSPSGPEIETHKQRIARAVNSVREKRQQQLQQQKQQSQGMKKKMRTLSSKQVRWYYNQNHKKIHVPTKFNIFTYYMYLSP